MLTLAESSGSSRRHNNSLTGEKKRNQKGKKRANKYEKVQKQRVLMQDVIEEKEELQIHELMPVEYKPDEHDDALNAAQVTFEQGSVTVDGQECQTMVPITCIDGVQSSNKYVIITLLEPEAQGITGHELLNHAELTEVISDDKSLHPKLHKKVLLLHKIEPQPTMATTATIQTSTETSQQIIKHESTDQLMSINFGDFTSNTNNDNKDPKDPKDLGLWIKQFPSLTLLYTESGKPYVKCPACTAMFFKGTSFEKHISCHLSKEDERYICEFCKYESEDPSALFSHMFIHQDQCEICNINLTRKNYFKKHTEYSEQLMTFTIKRDRWGRFVCIYCKLGFDLTHQLQKHWFKHSCNSKRTVQCNNCAGLFDTDDALKNHICLICPVCGKICDSVHRLRSHTRYEKHYLYCQICSYEFILSVDHAKHMELHKKLYSAHKEYAHCLESEDGTSFQCELCGKIYYTMSILILHVHDDHKIPEATKVVVLSEEDFARISLPEVKDGATSYDIINSLKNDLKCEVDFQRACEEVLETETERTTEKADETENNQVVVEQCEPVALCWGRYEIDEDQSTIRKAA